jgi:hypothetical protein
MKKIIVLCLALAFFAGCAGPAIKPFSEMNPKEKAIFFLKIYNGQFDSYQMQSAQPNLTAEQVKMLKAKRDILKAMHPMIQVYDMMVNAGGLPDIATEENILQFIDRLAALAGGAS